MQGEISAEGLLTRLPSILKGEVPAKGRRRGQRACDRQQHHQKGRLTNPAYIFRKQTVVNWFDKEEFKADHYSIKDKLGVLMANPKTAPIVGKLMEKAAASRGDVAKSASGNENLNKMLGVMSLESLIKKAGDAVPPEAVSALNSALQKIPKE